MRVTLNLASRPFADFGPAIKRLRMAMGALALLCICLLIGLYHLHQKAEAARRQEQTLDGAIARIRAERQGYQKTMQLPANAQLLAQSAALNQLFDEKSFSWTLAMENLETVLPAGVQVTALEPVRAKNGVITLHLRVVGPRDKSEELVKNLEQSKRFLDPRIVGENAESNDSPNKTLEPVSASNRFDFDLLAEYNPPAPGERKVSPAKVQADDADAQSANKSIHPVAPQMPKPRPMIPAPGGAR
jgi:type IV pilus assembly protein PilN